VLTHGHYTTIEDADVAFHQRESERLRVVVGGVGVVYPSGRARLNAFPSR
jgi:hypothetical protein